MRPKSVLLSVPLVIVSTALVLLPNLSHAEGPGDLPLRDDFKSEFTLDWETIRPDPTHLSLESHPGKLTITTQFGSIHGTQTTAKNLFFIDIPQQLEDFVVTTCIENFLPETRWQQAGLLFYNDDDHHFKWVRDYNQHCADLNAFWEIGDIRQGRPNPVEISKKRFWLRVIKRGNLYQCLASLDGKKFTTYSIVPWSDGPFEKVGLVAKNGPRQGDLEAQFDFFELRNLTDAERDDPVYKLRRELLGTWKAVDRRANGKPLKDGPATQLIVQPGTLVMQEKQKLQMSYTVDLSTTPNQITLIPRTHGVGPLLNGVFSLEGDTWTLCLNPKLKGSAPKSLESVEGDGYLLLKLERVPEPAAAPDA